MDKKASLTVYGISRWLAPVVYVLAGGALGAAMLVQLRPPAEAQVTIKPNVMNISTGSGAVLYQRYCVVCHGPNGEGNGPAAAVLDPKPRNFRMGKYRLITSTNGVPFKDDLVHTIRNGMPGTSMPAWTMLRDDEVDALADYVYSLTRESIRQQLVAKKLRPSLVDTLVKARTTASQKLVIPAEAPASAPQLAAAQKLFESTCAKCHNIDGTGRQDPAWRTDEGDPIASRNFTANIFKGGRRSSDLYTRIYTGLPGTPMTGFNSLPPSDIWGLVHYVQSLAAGKKPARPAGAAPAVAMQEGN